MQSGREIWSHGCEDLTGNSSCVDSVESEFRWVDKIVLCVAIFEASKWYASYYIDCFPSTRDSVSTSNNTLYYGNIFGKIVALQVGTFETSAPVASPPTTTPTSKPTEVKTIVPDTAPAPTELPTASPTDSEVSISPPEVGNINTSMQSPSGPSDKTTKALFAVASFIAVLAIGILTYVFISFRRRKQRKKSTLPVAEQWSKNHKPRDGNAVTDVSAGEPIETFGGNSKRKKKGKASSPEPISTSRLDAIAEAPDDMFEEESLEEGVELVHDDEDDEDIEKYVFSYEETAPGTSLSSSQSSPKSSSSPEQIAKATAGMAVAGMSPFPDVGRPRSSSSDSKNYDSTSNENDLRHVNRELTHQDVKGSVRMSERELVPVDADSPRPYYMLDIRPEGAGSIIKVNSGQAKDCVELTVENEPSTEKNIPLSHGQAFKHLRVDGTSASFYNIAMEQVADNGAIIPVRQASQSAYAVESGSTAKSLAQARTEYVEDDEQSKGHGIMVPVYRSQSHSVYAMGSPTLTKAVPFSRERSDATSSTVYIEDSKDIAAEGALGEVTSEQGQVHAKASESASKEHTLLLQKLRSAKSEAAVSLASIDEDAESAKPSGMVPVRNGGLSYAEESWSNNSEKPSSYFFEEQLSPCTSMYIDEESVAASTDDGTYISAPVDEKTSRPWPSPKKLNLSSQISPISTISPSAERKNASPPVTRAPVRMEVASPHYASNKSPAYVFKAPLSPGSTIATTSVYIDDDGSVEMERDDETIASAPLDERASQGVQMQQDTTPTSVKLDACASPPQSEEIPDEPAQDTKTISVRKSYRKSNKMRPSSSSQVGPLTPKGGRNSLLSSAPKLSPPPPLSPTSTSTNESKSSSTESANYSGEAAIEVRSSPRSMRKMRLERTIHDRKAQSPSVKEQAAAMRKMRLERTIRNRKTQSPSDKEHAATSFGDQTLARPYDQTLMPPPTNPTRYQKGASIVIDNQSHTTGDKTIAPRSPGSQSSHDSDLMDGIIPTSSDSDAPNGKPAPPPIKRITRNERSRRIARDSSASDALKKKAERNEDAAQPAVITSYFSGLIKQVEEAERQFFNPTLSQKKKTKKALKGSRQRKEYEAHLSDNDSLPLPPPAHH